jgi:hypothetical protein
MGAVLSLGPDASIGASPPVSVPLSLPAIHEEAMPTEPAHAPSRFAIWRSVESRADSLVSYGALLVAVTVAVVYALL